jgi:hypothetical protein
MFGPRYGDRWEAGRGGCLVSRVRCVDHGSGSGSGSGGGAGSDYGNGGGGRSGGGRELKLHLLAGLLLCLLPLTGSIDWYWDGIRYIQILEPRDETGSSPDGEYWTNYEPDPPDEYKWETFKAHSRDSHARDGEQDRADGSTCELGDIIAPDLSRCTEEPDELRAPRPSRTIEPWPELTAETTVSLTEGDTSTLAELGHPIGFGEWTKRTRYDDREGHPHLEYIEEAKDDCYHPFLVECMNGGTCYDLYEDHYCHCAKGFYGKHCELGDLIAQPEIPPRWRCPVSSLGNGDGCDCDCGGYDPDCADPSQPILNCKPSEICVNKTTAGDTYGMCVITLAAKPRQFRPRFTPGVRTSPAPRGLSRQTWLVQPAPRPAARSQHHPHSAAAVSLCVVANLGAGIPAADHVWSCVLRGRPVNVSRCFRHHNRADLPYQDLPVRRPVPYIWQQRLRREEPGLLLPSGSHP